MNFAFLTKKLYQLPARLAMVGKDKETNVLAQPMKARALLNRLALLVGCQDLTDRMDGGG